MRKLFFFSSLLLVIFDLRKFAGGKIHFLKVIKGDNLRQVSKNSSIMIHHDATNIIKLIL